MKINFIITSCILFIDFGCTIDTSKIGQLSPPVQLNQETLELRKNQLSDIHYRLQFDINKHHDYYMGQSEIFFSYNGNGKEIVIDFYDGLIDTIFLNNEAVNYHYNHQSISIETIHLNIGFNKLQINYRHKFTTDGPGLYKYTDPIDGNIYLYTHSLPCRTNNVFPAFDQPNLQATFEMQIKVDPSWKVITPTNEASIYEHEDGKNLWLFPKDHRYSTHTWSLYAGPYSLWQNNDFSYPLRLFCRKALAHYINPNEWFEWSKQGIDFFESYFSYPYPYKKLDILIIPNLYSEMNESLSTVPFSENHIPSGLNIDAFQLKIASAIMRKLSYIWLGGSEATASLDELLMKKSLSSLMVPLSLSSNNTLSTGAWKKFFEIKTSAYKYDENLKIYTTRFNSKDIDKTNRLSYEKGAASLKQVMLAVNKDNFQKGIQKYINTFKGNDKNLNNLIATLIQNSEIDSTKWAEQWLNTPETNHLIVDMLCEKGKISSLSFHQKSSLPNPVLKDHTTLLGFISSNNTKLSVEKLLKVNISGATTHIEKAKGMDCPDILFPNYQDYGFFTVTFDNKSMETIMHSISRIEDPLLKIQIWHSLWTMLRNHTITLDQFSSIALNALSLESDGTVANSLLNYIHGKQGQSPSVIYYLSKQSRLAKEKFLTQLEPILWQKIANIDTDNNNQNYWFNALSYSVESHEGLNRLASFLEKKQPFPKLRINQEMRWRVILRLSQMNYKKVRTLIDQENKQDRSLKGNQYALAAKSALPSSPLKRSLLVNLTRVNSPYSLIEKKIIIENIFPNSQENFRQGFSKDFFNYLDSLFQNDASPMLLETFGTLGPHDCKLSPLSEVYLNTKPDIPIQLTKILWENQYENHLCAKIIAANTHQ